MPTLIGQIDQQQDVYAIELRNGRGDSVRILTYGAIIAELNISTNNHGLINTVLGYPHWSSYQKDKAFHGAIAGRYCNRIADSQFQLESSHYKLHSNEGSHQLHGGPAGFSCKNWQIETCDEQHVSLSLISPDGDQGYPGNLKVLLSYMLDDGGLNIAWRATSDADTIVSLTSHGYFNLAGGGDIREHYLRIAASDYTPTDQDQIPTGQILPVANTALDLLRFKQLALILDCDDRSIEQYGGLDHNWARGDSGEMLLSAELLCPETDLLLQVSSTLPGLQCYTGNHLAANGIHGCHEGICLEPQHYPNSPNEPHFPSAILRAHETIEHKLCYRFKSVNAKEILSKGSDVYA
ncbi:MAG: galactose mutarotase [Halioglobus sp.]|nr:galactose mutarotase [Halioglobus sp.]